MIFTSLLLQTCEKEKLDSLTPLLTTLDIRDITATAAKSGGNITEDWGFLVTEKGVCWSTQPDPTTDYSKAKNNDSLNIGIFSSYLTGLKPNTVYFDVNEELEDNLGWGAPNSGHWECGTEIKAGYYGFENFSDDWDEHVLDCYCGHKLTGENYVYEFRIPIEFIYDNNLNTLNVFGLTHKELGFDVVINDHDEGAVTIQRKVWINNGSGT